jgi:hypothetical protein
MTDLTDLPDTATAPSQPRPRANRRLRLLGVLAAIVLPTLVWLVAGPLFGADLTVQDNNDPPKVIEIGFGPIVVVSAGFALLGWAALALLERLTRHGRLIWTGLAVALLVLSFLPLLGPMSAGTRVALGLVHLAVGAALIPTFYRSSPTP